MTINNDNLKNYAIVLASGSGSRFGGNKPKQFEKISDKTILELSLDIFEKNANIDEIILVINPEYKDLAIDITKNKYQKLCAIINGGETRKQSSSIGVNHIKDFEANVVIHDCARPFLSQEVLNNCIEALKTHDAIDVALPVTDTIVFVKENFIENIPNRETLYASQTPQCFKLSLIKKAHELACNNENFTDDCGIIMKYNLGKIYIVKGNIENFKITHPSDIELARKIFKNK